VDVEAVVRKFLTTELGRDVSRVGLDDSMLESGTIDSVGVMQLVAFLGKTYGITVEDDDLTPENFDTIGAIAAFVARRQAGARG
jgi:acyl carrier protein